MEILYPDQPSHDLFTQEKKLKKTYGAIMAKKIQSRIKQLENAANLGQLRQVSGRWHEISEIRPDRVSADLEHPMRLIIRPTPPIPRRADGLSLDWDAVVSVEIVWVGDTHDTSKRKDMP